jgi:hypothetical protein
MVTNLHTAYASVINSEQEEEEWVVIRGSHIKTREYGYRKIQQQMDRTNTA